MTLSKYIFQLLSIAILASSIFFGFSTTASAIVCQNYSSYECNYLPSYNQSVLLDVPKPKCTSADQYYDKDLKTCFSNNSIYSNPTSNLFFGNPGFFNNDYNNDFVGTGVCLDNCPNNYGYSTPIIPSTPATNNGGFSRSCSELYEYYQGVSLKTRNTILSTPDKTDCNNPELVCYGSGINGYPSLKGKICKEDLFNSNSYPIVEAPTPSGYTLNGQFLLGNDVTTIDGNYYGERLSQEGNFFLLGGGKADAGYYNQSIINQFDLTAAYGENSTYIDQFNYQINS